MRGGSQRKLTIALFSVYLVLLTAVVLFKLPWRFDFSDSVRTINLIPLLGSFDDTGMLDWREIILNALVFVPLGIYSSMLINTGNIVQRALPALCLSTVFELLQCAFALGRSDITDVVSNTIGALAGVAVYKLASSLYREKTALVVNAVALAFTVFAAVWFAYQFYVNNFVMSSLHMGSMHP
ncbi:MAG: VanZ family protein [Coriobacteriales bacterium]|jgi:glycopeptide antibiotics resistance protein|nr:VanZ family protein [Coriobacteriales bacterium]